jgi:hypothetical protein
MNHLLVDIAALEVGVREQGGDHRGPRIREYQSATWLEPAPWPWCAAFVDWIVREWLKHPDVLSWLKLSESQIPAWRPMTAGAWASGQLGGPGSRPRVSVPTETAKALPGDIIIFDFFMSGSSRPTTGRTFSTIEGNTNVIRCP